ncbi:MAG TPA: T9SS type A sorting domain-containing protein [Chitinophagales bacterium]|nr:T9SS type A sorting domain-containing protein [Chitinophagales bacterium]
MKTKYLLLLIFTGITRLYALSDLMIVNTKSQGQRYMGTIDTAVLSIKPQGAYMECGLYITFSGRQPSVQLNPADTFEVQMPFELPEGAFITDSWLWVGNQIMQATIMERDRANGIYEAIVDRRLDPSILVKNGPTQYQLNVFPLTSSTPRKVKITYLVPVNLLLNNASIPIPVNIIKKSNYQPHFEVLAYTGNGWHTPAISELPQLVFQQVSGEAFKKAVVPGNNLWVNGTLNYTISTPMQNGAYYTVYEHGPQSGYYQFVASLPQVFALSANHKTTFLIDHESGNSTTTLADVLANTRQYILANYNETDSFNLLYSDFGVYQYSDVWLPCDANTVNTAFNAIALAMPALSYSNLPALLHQGINFEKQQGSVADVVLISNSGHFYSVGLANQLLADVTDLIGNDSIIVNVLDYQATGLAATGGLSQAYYGNEYLYGKIAGVTGGVVQSVRANHSMFVVRNLPQIIDRFLQYSMGAMNDFNANTTSLNSGIHAFSNSVSQYPFAKPFVCIGRYTAGQPQQIQISGTYRGQLLSHTFNLNSSTQTDSANRRIWVAAYLDSLDRQVQTQLIVKQILDSALCSRILNRYTAFLALEPNDTLTACLQCDDETYNDGTTNNNNTSVFDVTSDAAIKAFPNPFSSAISIQVHVQQGDATLKIYNTLGQCVKTFVLDASTGNDIKLNWDGHSDSSDELAAGVYILVLETKTVNKTMRIIKN